MKAELTEAIEEKVRQMRDRFHIYGWRTKKIHRYAHCYQIWKPNHPEYCYFVAWVSRREGSFLLLSEIESDSYTEANQILRRNDED